LIDGMYAQVDATMQKSIQDALGGQQLTPEQQKIFDDMRARMIVILKDTMNWETLEPMFIDLYKKTFPQQEGDGMPAFYKSNAGKAVIAKLPLVMQNTMGMMQNRLAAMMPKVQQLQQETMAQLRDTAPKPK